MPGISSHSAEGKVSAAKLSAGGGAPLATWGAAVMRMVGLPLGAVAGWRVTRGPVGEAVGAGEAASARQQATVAERIHAQGFEMYGTRKLEEAEAYVRERYRGEVDKRFGLVASSKAKDLPAHGVNNGFQSTRRVRVGPWYNDPPSASDSCCQLQEVVTEFSCRGLELDFPIVRWGMICGERRIIGRASRSSGRRRATRISCG